MNQFSYSKKTVHKKHLKHRKTKQQKGGAAAAVQADYAGYLVRTLPPLDDELYYKIISNIKMAKAFGCKQNYNIFDLIIIILYIFVNIRPMLTNPVVASKCNELYTKLINISDIVTSFNDIKKKLNSLFTKNLNEQFNYLTYVELMNMDFHNYIDSMGRELFIPTQITEIKKLFIYNPRQRNILVVSSDDTMDYIKSIPESALHVECVKQDSSELEATIVKLKAEMQDQEKYISDSIIEKTGLKMEISRLLKEKTQCETAYASLYAQNNIIDKKYNELLEKLKEQLLQKGTFTSYKDSYKNHSKKLHPDKLESFKEQILKKCANVPEDFGEQFNNITVLSMRIGQLLQFLRDKNY
jgi:hypothetical protein